MIKKVLFVCLGNICRSPSAEGVFLAKLNELGLNEKYHVDSAGTGAWHVGNLADPRMRKHAAKRGYDLVSRARQVEEEDFDEFDIIIAMDGSNYRNLQNLSPNGTAELRMMTDFCSAYQSDEVPDPYYGGEDGFEHVLDLLEDACAGLLDYLESK